MRVSGVATEHRLHPVLVDAEQIEELGQIGRVPFAAQIGLGNTDVAAAQEPRGEAVVVDFHGGGRARPVAAKPDRAAVSQGHVKRAMMQPRAKAERQPDQAGQFRKRRVYGFRCDRNQLGHGRSIERRSTQTLAWLIYPASVLGTGGQRPRSIIVAFPARQAGIEACSVLRRPRHQPRALEPEPQRLPVDRRHDLQGDQRESKKRTPQLPGVERATAAIESCSEQGAFAVVSRIRNCTRSFGGSTRK